MEVPEIVLFARLRGLDVVKVSTFQDGIAVNSKYCVYRVIPGCRRVLLGFRKQVRALERFVKRLAAHPASSQ